MDPPKHNRATPAPVPGRRGIGRAAADKISSGSRAPANRGEKRGLGAQRQPRSSRKYRTHDHRDHDIALPSLYRPTMSDRRYFAYIMAKRHRRNRICRIVCPYQGVRRNFPIVRHGKLAMISDEPIPWSDGVTEDLYLADLMSFGGNSGSPVLLRLGGVSETGAISGYRYVLLGVMQGITRPNHR
jgi:hypothetical protein